MNQIYICALFVISLAFLIPNAVFASPIVPHQELSVSTGFSNNVTQTIGYDSLNFQTVTYVSDGNFLNATYFLPTKFNPNDTDVTTYGVEIGVDAKSGNGLAGINYIFSQTWNNGNWLVTYQQITSSGTLATIKQTTEPYDGRMNQDDYVNLSLDLRQLGSPESYDVVFFSEGEIHTPRYHIINGLPIVPKVIKGSSLVFVPSFSFSMETIPGPLMLIPGDHKDIILRLKTNANVNLPLLVQVPTNTVNGVTVTEFNQYQNYTLSNGSVDIPLEITVSQSTTSSLQTFPVTVNEFFNRLASIDKNSVNNDLIKYTLFTSEPILETFQLDVPVGEPQPTDWSLNIAGIAVGITAVGVIVSSLLTYRTIQLTKTELKARVRPILARTEIGESALKHEKETTVLLDHAISPKKALFQFSNVGQLSATNITKQWEVKIKRADGVFTDLKSLDSTSKTNSLPDMSPKEQYSIDIEWDLKHYNMAHDTDNCYFELLLKYKDKKNNDTYRYEMKGHFIDGGFIYLDSVDTS